MVLITKRDGTMSTLPPPATLEPKGKPKKPSPTPFDAGSKEFRSVRNHCARACYDFNNIPEDAEPSERVIAWRK